MVVVVVGFFMKFAKLFLFREKASMLPILRNSGFFFTISRNRRYSLLLISFKIKIVFKGNAEK